MKPEETLAARLLEFFSHDELKIFMEQPQFPSLCYASEMGWHFMLKKREDGNYLLIIEHPQGAM